MNVLRRWLKNPYTITSSRRQCADFDFEVRRWLHSRPNDFHMSTWEKFAIDTCIENIYSHNIYYTSKIWFHNRRDRREFIIRFQDSNGV
jgi:hypothetical protein